MLVVEVGKKETIDKALKRLKKKFDNTKVVKILREKKEFTKKSVRRRQQIRKATYIQKKLSKNED
jgi:small subunit ribosomal protein S21